MKDQSEMFINLCKMLKRRCAILYLIQKLKGHRMGGRVRSRLMHVMLQNQIEIRTKHFACFFFFFIIFYNQTCFTIKNRMVGECYEIYNFFILFDITIIFWDRMLMMSNKNRFFRPANCLHVITIRSLRFYFII